MTNVFFPRTRYPREVKVLLLLNVQFLDLAGALQRIPNRSLSLDRQTSQHKVEITIIGGSFNSIKVRTCFLSEFAIPKYFQRRYACRGYIQWPSKGYTKDAVDAAKQDRSTEGNKVERKKRPQLPKNCVELRGS